MNSRVDVGSQEIKRKNSVLVVDDSRSINALLCAQLKESGSFMVESAASQEEAKALLQEGRERFFIAILDLNLPDAPNGEVVELVRSYEIPVIVLTGCVDEQTRQTMLERKLVDYVVKRNLSELNYVVDLVRQLSINPRRKVLVVDDSTAFRLYIKGLLEVHRYHVVEAENGKQALEKLQKYSDIWLIITDFNMPEMDGVGLIENIRTQHGRDEISIIGMSTTDDSGVSVQLLKAGANDFIAKPFEVEEFYCRVTQNMEMLHKVRQLRDAATKDFLTGVFNRRHFFSLGEGYYESSVREKFPLAAAMIDVDDFKKVNDTYGHQAGDAVLKGLGNLLAESFREGDLIGRYGGEEFACVAITTDEQAAMTTFERVRKAIEEMEVTYDGGILRLTASIGMTMNHSENLGKMLDIADKALYQAKSEGKNRVVML
jgi:diguanylate cyclase (GGDEF)-like protein